MASDEGMESVLDPAMLADLRQLEDEGAGSIVEELIDSFLANTPGRLVTIRGEVAAGRADRVRFLAHALKGSSGVLGACRLADACGGLEEHACSGLDGRSHEYLDRLDWEFERARAELVAMRQAQS